MKPIKEYDERYRDKFLHMLNISTFDEFLDLWLDIDATFQKLDEMLVKIDKFCAAQAEFNKLVAERLHLDKMALIDNNERNMYG